MKLTKTISLLSISVLGIVLLPVDMSIAAAPNFKAFTMQLIEIIDLGTIALFSLAVVYFFWSVLKTMWGYDGGNAEQKKKLQETLFWGILILFIMVSIWGIIEILQITLSRGLS